MKYLLLGFSAFIQTLVFAQQKGATPILSEKQNGMRGNTYAVVVGISDYQDPAIPDLRFADRDAEAFVNFLRSPAGGSLDGDHVKLLTNEKATLAQIIGQLDWLTEVAKEGDRVIIYFSGHGDVETKRISQSGYLLGWDAPSRVYAAGGAINIRDFQDIISTLSVGNKAKVVVITDACHSGKLSGSEINGAQLAGQNLAQQLNNEVKILSCQPNEYSIEGEQWGGGRGAFSYNLVDALYGLADFNNDQYVTLLEVGRYLEDHVTAEVAPVSQIPKVVGLPSERLVSVNAKMLADLRSGKTYQLAIFSPIESRGIEDQVLTDVDTTVRELYYMFKKELKEKRLLSPLNASAGFEQACANTYFQQLLAEPKMERLYSTMRRNFAAALQDDAQQATNAYMQANPTELEKRWKGDNSYSQYPRYLQRAAELLGEKHYMYKPLLAKKLYFEGLNLRMLAEKRIEGSSYQKAIEKQDEALRLDDRAAYFYNELGVLYTRQTQSEKAIANYEKAIELAPEWGLPYVNLCLEYFYSNAYEKAIETGNKAIELMPNYPQLYNLMGWVSANYGGNRDKRGWKREGVELKNDFFYNYANTSNRAQKKIKFKRTIELLQKAIQVDSTFASAHGNLGGVYEMVGRFDEAVVHLKKSVQLDSTSDIAFFYLGICLYSQRKLQEGERAFKKAIQLALKFDPVRVPWWYNSLGDLYAEWGSQDKAIEAFQKALELYPDYSYAIRGLGLVYKDKGDFEKAEGLFLQSLIDDPETYLQFGRFYTALDRYKDAEWMYLKAIEKLSDYRNAISGLIELYQKMGNYEKALEWQQKLLKLAPDDPDTYFNAGKAAYLTKQFDKAVGYFQRYEELCTVKNRSQQVGVFYTVHSDFETAQKYLKKGIQMTPDIPWAYWDNAWLYYSTGDKKQAIHLIDESIEKFPENITLKALRAFWIVLSDSSSVTDTLFKALEKSKPGMAKIGDCLIMMKHHQYLAANELYKEIKASPSDWYVPYFLDLACIRMWVFKGDIDTAMDILDKAINWVFNYQFLQSDTALEALRKTNRFQSHLRRQFPEKYDDLDSFKFEEAKAPYFLKNCITLAKFYANQDEPARSKSMYEKALEAKPGIPTDEEAITLANACLQLGRKKEAIEFLPENVISEDAEVHNTAARLYYLSKRPEKAAIHFQRYEELSRLDYKCRVVGWFYHAHGDFEQAEKYLRKAVQNQPEVTYPYWDLGWLYCSFGRYQQAFNTLDTGITKCQDVYTLKGMKAFWVALSDTSTAADTLLNSLGLADLGACLTLMKQGKYEAAQASLKAIMAKSPEWWVGRFLNLAYARMWVKKGDLDAAMGIIEQVDTWVFNYQLLQYDPALEALRKTERYKAFIRMNFPEKTIN